MACFTVGGGAAGNVILWVRRLCELANGHTYMSGAFWQYSYPVGLKIKLWRGIHLLHPLKTTFCNRNDELCDTHTIVYITNWVISSHAVTSDLNVILCDK